MRKRKAVVMLFAVISAILFVSAASAEGSWTSYMTDWLTGHNSRNWTDNNSDAANTVIKFTNCTTSPPTSTVTASISLWQVIDFWPDNNMGGDTLSCHNTSDAGNWGRVPGGTYHYTLDKIDGQSSGYYLSVQTVKVSY